MVVDDKPFGRDISAFVRLGGGVGWGRQGYGIMYKEIRLPIKWAGRGNH